MKESREAREERIGRRLGELARSLGYAEAAIGREGVDKVWSYARQGSHVESEALLFCLHRRPTSDLVVEFWGSVHPVRALEDKGLPGQAGAMYLPQYQVHVLGREAREVLPQAIPVGPEADIDATLSRLAQEVRAVDRVIWQDMKKRLEAGKKADAER